MTVCILADLLSLVRFAIHQDNELVQSPERVNANPSALPSCGAGHRLATAHRSR